MLPELTDKSCCFLKGDVSGPNSLCGSPRGGWLAELLGFLGGDAIAVIGFGLADPGAQGFGVDAHVTGHVGDRAARERASRTARSRSSSGDLRGAAMSV